MHVYSYIYSYIIQLRLSERASDDGLIGVYLGPDNQGILFVASKFAIVSLLYVFDQCFHEILEVFLCIKISLFAKAAACKM